MSWVREESNGLLFAYEEEGRDNRFWTWLLKESEEDNLWCVNLRWQLLYKHLNYTILVLENSMQYFMYLWICVFVFAHSSLCLSWPPALFSHINLYSSFRTLLQYPFLCHICPILWNSHSLPQAPWVVCVPSVCLSDQSSIQGGEIEQTDGLDAFKAHLFISGPEAPNPLVKFCT